MGTSSGAEAGEAAVCPICKGAGFVHPRLPSGEPDYSRTVPCRCTQTEREKERRSRLLRYSGLEARLLQNMTFDSFNWKQNKLSPEQRENLKNAFDTALDFAKAPEGWLVFQGVNGCGKTHLAAAIANHRFKEGKPVKFVVVPDLLDHLRSTFSPQSPVSYDQLFEEVKNAPLLILDDLGKQTTTPWAEEKLYQIINHRYNHQLPTVVTTNCTTDELDSPISSRFADAKISVLFHIMAPGYGPNEPAPERATRKKKPA
jgi:DNA replication protein DnaC